MSESIAKHDIQSHKITKPIQLLAAWLVGLVLTNSLFLGTAVCLNSADWERGWLIIAAIVNVPIFLIALFILQTKFRAELQEDTFYAEYLSKKTAGVVRIDKNLAQDVAIESLAKKLTELERRSILASERTILRDSSVGYSPEDLDWESWTIAINRKHPKYTEIRQALKTEGIPVGEIFASAEAAELPSLWVISLSYALPFQNRIALLRTLLPFNFDGFQLWEPQVEAGETEDVYIGSYGVSKVAPMGDELAKLIDSEPEPADLKDYYRRNKAAKQTEVKPDDQPPDLPRR